MCRECTIVSDWDETVQRIGIIDPGNILVTRASEGKKTTMKSLRGGQDPRGDRTDEAPARLTHRCVFQRAVEGGLLEVQPSSARDSPGSVCGAHRVPLPSVQLRSGRQGDADFGTAYRGYGVPSLRDQAGRDYPLVAQPSVAEGDCRHRYGTIEA